MLRVNRLLELLKDFSTRLTEIANETPTTPAKHRGIINKTLCVKTNNGQTSFHISPYVQLLHYLLIVFGGINLCFLKARNTENSIHCHRKKKHFLF